MRGIKSLDFYRKYLSENRIPTFFGALMSTLTIILMLVFAGFELKKYLVPNITHKVGLIQFPVSTHENTVPLNFDISFFKIPCERTLLLSSSYNAFKK